MKDHNTDGIILKKISQIKEKTINKFVTFSIIIWFLTPLLTMALNIVGVSNYNYHSIMSIVLYFTGCISLLFGCVFLYQYLGSLKKTRTELLEIMLPFILIIVLGIFILISVFCSEEKRMAIYGYESFRDNIITFIFYGGFILGGLTLSKNEDLFKIPLIILCIISIILSIVVGIDLLFDNSITGSLLSNVNEASIFDAGVLNSDYYGRYFLMSSCAILVLLVNSKKSVFKVLLLLSLLLVTIAIFLVGGIYASIVLIVCFLLMIAIFAIRHNISSAAGAIATLILGAVIGYFFVRNSGVTLSDYFLSDPFSDKVDLWKDGMKVAGASAIVGIGPNNTVKNYENSYIQFLVYTGGFGFLLLLSFLIIVAKRFFEKRFCSLTTNELIVIIFTIGYFVISFFSPILYNLSPYCCILLGYLIYGTIKNADKSNFDT